MDAQTYAANAIAEALTTIHNNLSVLAPTDATLLAGAFGFNDASFGARVDYAATTMAALRPIEPVTEGQKAILIESLSEMVADMRHIEVARAMTDFYSELNWREEVDAQIEAIEQDIKAEEESPDVDAETMATLRDQLAALRDAV